MGAERNNILTIAGFDPTGGAGILADIKTFEQHKLLGFAVQTANTIQTEDSFVVPQWIVMDDLLQQLDVILKNQTFDYVKIGIVEKPSALIKIAERLIEHNSNVKIIWDPVITSSSGYQFFSDWESAAFKELLTFIYIITPNWQEAQQLTMLDDVTEAAMLLAKSTNVYLTGGHNSNEPGRDYLFYEGKHYPFKPMGTRVTPKHGSGCIFSAALTANLCKGYPIIKACLRAKNYTTRVLESNSGLLGYHKF